jgi:hypothetical protein
MYVARVLGRFPEEGEDTLLPLSWLNAAVKRYDDKPSKELLVSDHVYLGTDVARYGMDKSVCCVYQPNKVVHLKKLQGKDTTAVTRMCSAEAVSVGNRLVQITVDDTGVGGGVTDQLRMQGYPTVGVNFAQKSTNPRFFRKLKDELMWNVRLHLQAGDIALPPDDELIGQLSSLKYKADQATGLIEIEDKEEMRKRGLKSPDCAWALALALWGSKKIRALPRTVQGARAQERSRSREIERWY